MKILSFRRFLIENEDRLEFIKKANPHIDRSHDPTSFHLLQQNWKPGDDKISSTNSHGVVHFIANHMDPSHNKKNTQWLVNKYKKKQFRLEDHPRIHSAISGFETHKHKFEGPYRDLNHYHHISDVEDAIAPHIHAPPTMSHKQQKKMEKGGADLIHSENGVTVHRINTKEAACHYGAGTKWCTAAHHNNMFDDYHKEGPLYVVHTPARHDHAHAQDRFGTSNSGKGGKYQFHFESHQFMDEKDREVNLHNMSKVYPELKNVNEWKPAHIKHARSIHDLHLLHPEHKERLFDIMATDEDPHEEHAYDKKIELAEHSSKHAMMMLRHKEYLTTPLKHAMTTHYEVAKHMIHDEEPSVRSHIVSQHPSLAHHFLNDPDEHVKRRANNSHKYHQGLQAIEDAKSLINKGKK